MSHLSILGGDIVVVNDGNKQDRIQVRSVPLPWGFNSKYQGITLNRGEGRRRPQPKETRRSFHISQVVSKE